MSTSGLVIIGGIPSKYVEIDSSDSWAKFAGKAASSAGASDQQRQKCTQSSAPLRQTTRNSLPGTLPSILSSSEFSSSFQDFSPVHSFVELRLTLSSTFLKMLRLRLGSSKKASDTLTRSKFEGWSGDDLLLRSEKMRNLYAKVLYSKTKLEYNQIKQYLKDNQILTRSTTK
jgi:hypothetical protein